jgi:hypothetical protein
MKRLAEEGNDIAEIASNEISRVYASTIMECCALIHLYNTISL